MIITNFKMLNNFAKIEMKMKMWIILQMIPWNFYASLSFQYLC
jgi:hypothetical protein